MKPPSCASGGRSVARSSRRISPTTSSFNLVLQQKLSTGIGTSATPALRSHASNIDSGIRCSDGWPRPLMACAGHRRGFRGQVHAALVILGGSRGREAYGPAPTQFVGDQFSAGGALNNHRRRQVGRDQDFSRSALPAPPVNRREEVLALRRERGAPSPL